MLNIASETITAAHLKHTEDSVLHGNGEQLVVEDGQSEVSAADACRWTRTTTVSSYRTLTNFFNFPPRTGGEDFLCAVIVVDGG